MPERYIKTMKKGDTGEPFQIRIRSRIGLDPVNLTGASALFKMIQIADDSTSTELVNAAAVVEVPETEGLITYSWQSGDTDTPGTHQAFIIVTYDGGVVETYPRDGFFEIRIEEIDK